MTEKRFKETISTGIVIDTVTGKEYNCEMRIDDDFLNLVNDLADENEQLKQRNDRQAKQLDRLYRLIEEKNWRALSDILNDFKRCDEQLQKEWRTYGDFE